MHNPKKNDTFKESFKYAWEGIKVAYKEERNIRKHILTTILVFLLGILMSFTIIEFLWLTVACFLVVFSELLNTIIENLVDLVTTEYHPLAKKVKDIAAGTVLISTAFAVMIGILLFLPKINILLR